MRLFWLLAPLLAVSGPVVHQDYEREARGERCGWMDYQTLVGDSSAGVTAATASPFAGGLQAYAFYRAPNRDNGWALLDFPETAGPVCLTLDVMVPAGGGGSLQLHLGSRASYTTLIFSAADGLGVQTGRREQRQVAPLEPHVWHRVILHLAGPEAATFDLELQRHRPRQEPEVATCKALPALDTGDSFGRFKLSAPAGHLFYIDNLTLEHAAR